MDPKIIKVNKGLPDVFIQQRNNPKDRQRKHVQKSDKVKEKVEVGQKVVHQDRQSSERTDKNNKKKKNRNPFLNVRQYLRLSKEMDERMKQVRKQLQLDRFAQLSFQNNPDVVSNTSIKEEVKQNKIKHEDCLTLSIMKKSQTSCLRKILHVPTLIVYFLREAIIDFSIDKGDLQEWISKSNSSIHSGSARPQKIVQLYWNVPQGYYSIIYQYIDGVLLDLILQNTSIFSINFIQNLALTHIKSNYQIFNSILLIKRNQSSEIQYLPIYEEIDDIIPQYRTFRELLKIDNELSEDTNIKNIQKMMTAKLGFLILVCFFSDAIIDEDIANILFESKDCCLFHKQLSNSNSLIKVYFQSNISSTMEKQIISDFFCKILKFKPEDRANFSELIKHKFFKTKFTGEICSMQEVIFMLESTGPSSSSKSTTRQFCIHKLNKLINSMSLILQGCPQKQKKQIELNPANENIKYILHDIGLGNTEPEIKAYTNQLINKLRKLYDQ